jgi:hypothetical protein
MSHWVRLSDALANDAVATVKTGNSILRVNQKVVAISHILTLS